MSKNTRKGEVKKLAIIVIAIMLLIAVIGGTYSKYTSTANGSGDVAIAQWAVSVNGQNASSSSANFDLTFALNNADTVANKIAPGGTATAYVDVDLTGTEVSVKFDVDTQADLATIFGTGYSNRITLTTGTPISQGETSNMTLDNVNDVVTVGTTAMSGIVRVPVILTWNDVEGNDVADTTIATNKTSVTLPVTLTVSQKVGNN